MNKWHQLDAKTRKLIIEVGVLLVVVIFAIMYLISSSQPPADVVQPVDPSRPQISTEFNTAALELIQSMSNERPALDGDVGTQNPFTF